MQSIDIEELPFFSKLVKDYLKQKDKTKPLYSFGPSMSGLKEALVSKEKNYSHRELLTTLLDKNYSSSQSYTPEEKENIELLKTDGFAVTTAHQPNLFLGPLYTITKAVSTIALSKHLNTELKGKKIVPIFVIGSEDHDKEELLHAFLFGKRHTWDTEQKGAIGSMKIDESFIQLVNEWTNTFGNMAYAEELKDIYLSSYKLNYSIAESTRLILRKLFGKYGLIVLDLNHKEVKEAMIPVFKKELNHNFAVNAIQSHLDFLRSEYTIQAEPRDINLFEYKNGERIRIDTLDDSVIAKLNLQPESFSPNVILRPLMQQTVLPSIANIGGAAELSYWLQLKPIFQEEKIDFPVILLRDIFSPIDQRSYDKWIENKLELKDFFLPTEDFKKKIILKDSNLQKDFKEIEDSTLSNFSSIANVLSVVDKSLIGTYQSEYTKLQKSIELLYSKALKAEKKKSEELINSLEKIKIKVFESNYLIERKENFSNYYLRFGPQWIEDMIEKSNPLEGKLKIHIL